jgi:beta-N-acetylhexosaminidase
VSSATHPPFATTLLPGFLGTELPDWLAARLRSGLGGVCLFGQNIVSTEQVRALTDAIYEANPLAIIAIDEEGGDVTRLHYADGSPYPGSAVLGRIDDLTTTGEVARAVGWELRRAGVNLDFAPDVDINSNPDNPVIGVRSFGALAEPVARHSAAWVRGLQSTGVAATVKHFPGHGDTAQDSHLALPIVDRSLEMLQERELVPFVAAIRAGARAVMTSHILLPQVDAAHPATMSSGILTGLLRGELGFDGVIVTDALDMAGASADRGIDGAAVLALDAGSDLLCLGTENTDEQLTEIERTLAAAVDSGMLSADRVADAARRVLALADELAAERTAIGVPPVTGDVLETALEPAVIASFDSRPGASEWLRDHPDHTVVRIETSSNIAVGIAPWGPFAETAADPDRSANRAFTERRQLVLGADQPLPTDLPAGKPLLVIGRSIHRYRFAREAIDALRGAGRPILIVDMGWPSDDRAVADVATFGASRLVGRALIDWLATELD